MTASRLRETPRRSFGAIVARLTSLNVFLQACAIVTSPILARGLKPAGRGEVAAIFAVVSIAPWVSELGVTSFLTRERARRARPLGVLLGSMLPISLAGSLVGVLLAVPIAHALGRGRPVVIEYIELGLYLLPLAVFTGTLNGLVVADQRWGVYMLTKVINTVGAAAAIVVLALLHALTVTSVAITYVACGILSGLPLLTALRGSRPWRFEPQVARTGFGFGIRSWLSTIAQTGNVQLDQVLMAGLVSSRQLGLYSLAATVSTVPTALVGAASNALFPRVAAGDSMLAARASRVTFLVVILFALSVAASSPLVFPLLFGRAFDDAIPMLIILLGAAAFGPPVALLGQALIAAGNPSPTARGQVAGLIVTVPALIVVLPFAGGIGAAWVTLAAYGVTFVITVTAAAKTFALPKRVLLVATPEDLRWIWNKRRRRGSASA